MKKLSFLLIISLNITLLNAQPAGYYSTATGTGYTLKTQLYNIIKANYSQVGYSGVWDAYYTTDKRDDGYVWDIYADCNFVFGDDQDDGSGGTVECDKYNREHTVPQSLFDSNEPMRSDLFHVYPSDKKVNGVRSDYPFGETNSPTYTSGNDTKIGPCSFSGYSGTICEPADEYKGDIARSYFYMVTRYQDVITGWNSYEMFDGTSEQCLTNWALNLLISWHEADPVSQKEIDRNNAIYNIQKNRNPYIDHPEWVECVFENDCVAAINDMSDHFVVFPNPSSDGNITVRSDNETIITISVTNINGQQIYSDEINSYDAVIDISNSSKGVYFLKIETDNNIKYEKIIIQ